MRFFIAILLIVGCGEHQQDSASSAVVAQASSEANGEPSTPSEVDVKAKYYASEDDVPRCDESTLKQLVYIDAISSFHYCNGEEWVSIDFKSQKGDKGDPGAAGEDGVDGINGKNGLDGKDGLDGRDARNIASNEWEHPITDTIWFVGQTISYQDASNGEVLCPSGSRGPTDAEVEDAVNAGMMSKFTSNIYIIGPAKTKRIALDVLITIQSPFSQHFEHYEGDVNTIRIASGLTSFSPSFSDAGWLSQDPNASYSTTKQVLCIED
jgi:hypothetical protein